MRLLAQFKSALLNHLKTHPFCTSFPRISPLLSSFHPLYIANPAYILPEVYIPSNSLPHFLVIAFFSTDFLPISTRKPFLNWQKTDHFAIYAPHTLIQTPARTSAPAPAFDCTSSVGRGPAPRPFHPTVPSEGGQSRLATPLHRKAGTRPPPRLTPDTNKKINIS